MGTIVKYDGRLEQPGFLDRSAAPTGRTHMSVMEIGNHEIHSTRAIGPFCTSADAAAVGWN